MTALIIALYIVGGLLCAIEVVQTRGRSLTGWGGVALAVALILPHVVT